MLLRKGADRDHPSRVPFNFGAEPAQLLGDSRAAEPDSGRPAAKVKSLMIENRARMRILHFVGDGDGPAGFSRIAAEYGGRVTFVTFL